MQKQPAFGQQLFWVPHGVVFFCEENTSFSYLFSHPLLISFSQTPPPHTHHGITILTFDKPLVSKDVSAGPETQCGPPFASPPHSCAHLPELWTQGHYKGLLAHGQEGPKGEKKYTSPCPPLLMLD